MTDIYCPRCGEPVEFDYLHEVTEKALEGIVYSDKMYSEKFNEIQAGFRKNGCIALGFRPCDYKNNTRSQLAQVAYEVMGDDLDGAASMLDDARMMGLLK